MVYLPSVKFRSVTQRRKKHDLSASSEDQQALLISLKPVVLISDTLKSQFSEDGRIYVVSPVNRWEVILRES